MLNNMKWIHGSRVLLAAYVLTLLIASCTPSRDLGTAETWIASVSDKLLHVIAYALLAAIAVVARPFNLNRRSLILSIGGVVVLLSVATEVGQAFVPGRTFSWLDASASFSGGVSALILIAGWQEYRARYKDS
jgi:VanZ family protein